jgi:hypothetical protein
VLAAAGGHGALRWRSIRCRPACRRALVERAQARADVCAALAELARDDAATRELYASRQRALEALALPGATAAGPASKEASAGSVEQQALQALERGDAAALQGLAESMLGRAQPAGQEGTATARGAITAPAVLGEPLPGACLPRAKALGLEGGETTLASPAVARAIADFVERYALGASPAVHDRARDGVAHVAGAAKELAVPPELAAIFAETISLFALHQYVNSAGVRYVPVPAPREAVLIEAHADGDEAVTPLLRELGLDRRRGLSRDDIEAGLQKHGARVLVEQLGLDPLAFRIVCVPPDVFMRLGRTRGWGQRPEWTHFDGYQVVRGGRLRALVGGNANFGGLFDLCSISRDDARDNTVSRFAVIRRERLQCGSDEPLLRGTPRVLSGPDAASRIALARSQSSYRRLRRTDDAPGTVTQPSGFLAYSRLQAGGQARHSVSCARREHRLLREGHPRPGDGVAGARDERRRLAGGPAASGRSPVRHAAEPPADLLRDRAGSRPADHAHPGGAHRSDALLDDDGRRVADRSDLWHGGRGEAAGDGHAGVGRRGGAESSARRRTGGLIAAVDAA